MPEMLNLGSADPLAGSNSLWDAGTALGTLIDRAGGVIERYDDPTEFASRVRLEAGRCRRSIWSALPGGHYDVRVLRSTWELDLQLIHSGLAGPCIYQADAARTPEVLRYLTEFAAAGARVRLARRVPHRMIVFDRRVVAVAVEVDTMNVPFILTDAPAVVHSFTQEFLVTWRYAHRVGERDGGLAEQVVRDVLEVLASGVTDQAGARRLGVSERTLRRRITAVLDMLGARSRFEAGVKAVQEGWL